jgi:hypothetical protein
MPKYKRFIDSDNNLIIGITNDLSEYEQMDEVDAEFAKRGYTKDVDYEWGIAGGDDLPHCFIVMSERLKNDLEALDVILDDYEGKSCYG